MAAIKLGEPQPLPCPKCKETLGFYTTDIVQVRYFDYSEPNGRRKSYELDRTASTTKGTEPCCSKCGTKLPFIINH